MSEVLEIVIYKLKDAVSDSAFLTVGETMERNFAMKQKGFVKRLFGKSPEGECVDVITWASMDDALKASAAAMSSPACAPMFG
jgi:uncharacterized protein YfbU (UPF0304 family)